MKEILKELSKPLTKNDIELRVGACSSKGFSLLLYKTARTDMNRLNSVCGVLWGNNHFYDNKGLLCCSIRVFDEETNQWIERSDVGVESHTEKEKGLYSDSFKRAGFRWGIGLELYNSPFIFVKWEMEQKTENNKKAYKPKSLYPRGLTIDEYEVKDGTPKLKISYKGNQIFKG